MRQFFILRGFWVWGTRIRRNFSILTSRGTPTEHGYIIKFRGQNMQISKMSPNQLIFCTWGFSTMGNTMAIIFFNKSFIKIRKLGGYLLKIEKFRFSKNLSKSKGFWYMVHIAVILQARTADKVSLES